MVDFSLTDADKKIAEAQASFLKLRELTVGYTLPEAWVTAVGASRVMVSVTGRNLLTWTRYPGLEPEAMFLGGSRGGNFVGQ